MVQLETLKHRTLKKFYSLCPLISEISAGDGDLKSMGRVNQSNKKKSRMVTTVTTKMFKKVTEISKRLTSSLDWFMINNKNTYHYCLQIFCIYWPLQSEMPDWDRIGPFLTHFCPVIVAEFSQEDSWGNIFSEIRHRLKLSFVSSIITVHNTESPLIYKFAAQNDPHLRFVRVIWGFWETQIWPIIIIQQKQVFY